MKSFGRFGGCGLFLVTLLISLDHASAARISELVETNFWDQTLRFFSFSDPSLRYALAGSILLGLACGLMGTFLVVRKLALMSDSLSHAVLPGVAVGFLWTMTKNPLAIFVGATIAGLLGAATAQAITSTTKHKEDAALGFVLAAFFALGVCLMTMIQNLPGGSKSGLDKFLFGQAAAMGPADVWLLGGVTVFCCGTIAIFYKEFLVTSFDPGFARSCGLRVRIFHYALILMLAFAIVASLQAVGVVLVAAMLVIPAAAAFLLTERLPTMLALAAIFGMASGAIGAFFSFVGRNLPTGPVMVLTASAVFAAALFFAPRHGILAKAWRHQTSRRRIARENTLKATYRILEDDHFVSQSVSVRELAEKRREPIEQAEAQVKTLIRHGLASRDSLGQDFTLTPEGWKRACEIVRNHRLWELYLNHAANIPADHVHDEAEEIEHVLGEETVRQLEKRLNFARRDPHGKLIPGLEDIHGAGGRFAAGSAVDFGGTRK